ncbi:protein CbbY [Aureimonas sp. SA4125]|uniref:HAD-IA family hydrolase n=1 Tax=Aureimonas sp. SA4125 TaxID=2826993 RepID=UPI001CC7E590|nr:HAD-IA family hydrolase [Aureimonas sp. SA4125]BDA83300.1 protein CbbY [Aureimonas sp. SA4125]
MSAFIFDVDGTLSETEEMHRAAFNAAFAEANLPWHWDTDRYRELLKVSGGKERLRTFVEEGEIVSDMPFDALIPALHQAKTRHYVEAVAGGQTALRPGVLDLVMEARRRGIRLAIATTTSRENVDGLLATAFGDADLFEVIACGDMVAEKKPAPDIYDLALERLGLPAEACLAFEDSSNGLRAAKAAGLRCVVTPARYTLDEDFTGADLVLPDLRHAGPVWKLFGAGDGKQPPGLPLSP